jgi:hypothetical protein
MTPEDAERLLRELDDLCVRVAVQERRLGVDDVDITSLKRDIQARRDSIVSFLAAWYVATARARRPSIDGAGTLH